jgi:soluble lytic murein transglycosylase-like protein
MEWKSMKNDLRAGLRPPGIEWDVSLEHRTAERRADGRADRGAAERRHGQRRARATAGLVLVAAAVTASATSDRAALDTETQALAALPSTTAGSTEGLTGGLWPSLNSDFDVHIEAAAARHGVSRELVRAVIQVESGFDRLAVSSAGARGLMQLMPATARRFGVINRFDARQNIFGGTRYLRALLDRYQGDVSLTAAAYNAGASCVARYQGIPPYKETQDFVRKVTTLVVAAQREGDGAQDREARLGGKG